jgi:hypothetical protein
LLEALVAIAVLGAGTAAISGLLTVIANANERMAFQRRADQVFKRVAAEIEDATCRCPDAACAVTILDPGIDPAVHGAAHTLPGGACPHAAGTSVVETCGDVLDWVPPMHVSIVSTLHGTVLPGAPPSYDVEVRVREIRRNAAEDAATGGYWIRDYPISKTCSFTVDDTARGAFF